MATIVPFIKPRVPEPKCSFCERPKSEVPGNLLIGPEGYSARICADCARHAHQRKQETPDADLS